MMAPVLDRPVAPTRDAVFVDQTRTVELAHRSGDASGYGSLVTQIRRGLVACGVRVTEADMWGVLERMVYNPKPRQLVDIPVGPGSVLRRWVNPDGAEARFGTKARAHAGDRDIMPAPLSEPVTRPDAVRLAVGLPEYARYDGAGVRALYTMWESTEVPGGERAWGPHLERADVVIVPAEFSRRVIQAAAPRARVRVVPLGLDAASWPVQRRERRADAPFVFLMVGDLSSRKGWRLAYLAHMKAFGADPAVQLVFKTRGSSELAMWHFTPRWVDAVEDDGTPILGDDGCQRVTRNREPSRYYMHNGDWSQPMRGDPNVRILRGEWSKRNLMKLYAAADCFVWPSLGEGWGYPPREAAATGLPVITCAHTGMDDAGDWAYTIPFEEGRIPALFRHWGGRCGTFPLPDVDALAERMRWVYDNREEAAAFGLAASGTVTRRTTADAAADIIRELEEVGGWAK